MHGLVRVELVWWTDRKAMVESSGEPFMAPSRPALCKVLGGGEIEERHTHSIGLLQGVYRCEVVNRKLTLVAGGMMSR